MSNEFNEPAHPCEHYDYGDESKYFGLTIRQQAALMIAAGMATNPTILNSAQGWSDTFVANMACALADAVLKAERESRDESSR